MSGCDCDVALRSASSPAPEEGELAIGVNVQRPVPSPTRVSKCVWYFVRAGLVGGSATRRLYDAKGPAYLREMVMSEMPSNFACSYIWPSTSLDTALVHSIGTR